jgi:D-3-phosphoglycerate dehydrogenase
MKVLVADKLETSGLEGIKRLGCEVIFEPDISGDSLRDKVAESGADVLIVRSTKVPKEVSNAGKLGLIIRAGAGVNTIDVEAASERGILVANCPGKNSIAVAELAFGLMLSLDRHIPECYQEFNAGHWNKKAYSKAKGLYGRTLGLVGLGAIGQEMITRAKAFGMKVVAMSRWLTPDVAAALNIGRATSLQDIADQCDIISLHVSLRPETRNLINEEFIASLKPGSMLINTSRSEVVDQAALKKAVDEGRIVAGMDVFAEEPSFAEGEFTSELQGTKGVVITHHIGASTEQAQEAVAAETVKIVRDFLTTGNVTRANAVNVRSGQTTTSHLIIVRHKDEVGVLADVFAVLKGAGVNVQEMENIVLASAKSAIAQIAVDQEVSAETLTALKMILAVYDVTQMDIRAARSGQE